jgi:hypothetical protein
MGALKAMAKVRAVASLLFFFLNSLPEKIGRRLDSGVNNRSRQLFLIH